MRGKLGKGDRETEEKKNPHSQESLCAGSDAIAV